MSTPSNSQKKSSGGSSTPTAKKNASSRSGTASGSGSGQQPRKLSTKPAIAAATPPVPYIDFSLPTPATQTPQPLWPTWTLTKAQKECAGQKAQYTDPDGFPRLPASLQSACAGFKRLSELYPAGVADKLLVTPAEGAATMHRAESGSGIHAYRGWNQIVAAQLNLILTKRKLFTSNPEANFLWSHIQPQGAKDNIVRYNALGKYVMRIFHQGDWKQVVIDDYVPVDAFGKNILPVCSNAMEIWPILLSKLLLKVWPGYDFSSEGNGGGVEILYTLCGWICQSSVPSKSILKFPYSKANRPSSPVLPFNPLTDSAPTNSQTASSNIAATSQSTSTNSRVSTAPTTPSLTSTSKLGKEGSPSTTSSKSSKKGAAAALKDIEVIEELNAPPPMPTLYSTDQLHTLASRRGELGWYNELVYAAPGSVVNEADGGAAPSGLLFGYVWGNLGSGIEGYPSLAAVMAVEADRLPVFGAAAYEFDENATPLAQALAAQAAAAAAAAAQASLPSTPNQPTKPGSSSKTPSNPKSAAGKPSNASSASSAAPSPLPPAAGPTAEEAAQALAAAQAAEDAFLSGILPPRYHCLLLDCFDPEQEKREMEASWEAVPETDPKAAAANAKNAKGGAAAAKGPQTPQGAKKPVPPATGSANMTSPKVVGLAGKAGAKGKKGEEEERLRREEEERLSAEAVAKETKIRAEEEKARAEKAKARMEAWLRGEEAMLAEEELSKTTPQLKITDLLSGDVAVARVDSFAEQYDSLHLLRDPARYGCVSRVADLWGGKELRKPFASTPAATLFVPDVTVSAIPLFTPTQPPPPVDLDAALAKGIPAAAAQAVQAHHEREASSALVVESAVFTRRLYLHVEFQTNHQQNGGASDAEPLSVIPSTASLKPQPPSAEALAAASASAASKDKKASPLSPTAGKGGKPGSGGKNKHAPPAASDVPNFGPLQLNPSPLTWSVTLERYDWQTNRREIVEQRLVEPRDDESEVRLTTLEFILPATDPSTLPPRSSSNTDPATSPGSAPNSRPGSGHGSHSPAKREEKKPSSSKREKDAAPVVTGPPPPGIVYRVLVSSTFGYSMTAFAHQVFELEEGKPGATAAMAAVASGEGGSSAKKELLPTTGSALTNGGQLLERVVPNTFVKSLEGSYLAQNPSNYFVLFKYVVEVPTPIVPLSLSVDGGGSFSIPNEVSAAVETKRSARGKESKPSTSDKKKAAAAQAAQQQAEAEAAQAAQQAAIAAAQAAAASNPNAPVIYSKQLMPQSAQQANSSLSSSWNHPNKGQPGAGVCAPVVFGPASKKAGSTLSSPDARPRTTESDQLTEAPLDAEAASSSPAAPAPAASTATASLWSPLESLNNPRSTLLSASVAVQDLALLPYLRLEWVNNDTLESWLVPIGEQHTPAMQFLPNAHGYTLTCSAYVPNYQVFAGKFFVKLLSSRALNCFTIETLAATTYFQDDYRVNTARNLTRLVVVGSASGPVQVKGEAVQSNALPQSLLHFQTNVPASGLVCKVYDLDQSLDYSLTTPPPPIAVILGVSSVTVPVFMVTKESKRVLIDVSFDSLHPTQEVFAQFAAAALANAPPAATPSHNKDGSSYTPPPPATGITWQAKFISSMPVSVAVDKAPEDELLALKASWANGDGQRSKKARSSREAFLELRAAQNAKFAQQKSSSTGLPAIAAATPAHKDKAESTSSKKSSENVVLPPLPSPPVVLQSSLGESHPVVWNDAIENDAKVSLQTELEKARVLRASLEKQRECVSDYLKKKYEDREGAFSVWRNESDSVTHEMWQQRQEMRRALIGNEVEIAELKAILAQQTETTSQLQTVANYEELNASHTPFNDFPIKDAASVAPSGKEKTTPTAKEGSSGSNKKKALESALVVESGKFGLSAYLEAIESALPPIAALPAWKGGALTSQSVHRAQDVLVEALTVPLNQSATYLAFREREVANPPPPATPSAGSRKEKEKGVSGKDAKAAAAAAAAAIADGSIPAPIERLSLANALWHGVLNSRALAPKVTPNAEGDRAVLSAEIALFALSLEQLDKACEPLRALEVFQANQAAQAAAAAASKGLEEEKSNDEPVTAKGKKNSKADKAAAAAAAAAAIPPQPDFGLVDQWLNQAKQYEYLSALHVPPSHSEHLEPAVPLSMPSRPVSPAPIPQRPTTDRPLAQWFGAGSEAFHLQKQSEIVNGEDGGSPSPLPVASPTHAASTILPPPVSSLFETIDLAALSDSGARAAAALGRESVSAFLSSSLPEDSDVEEPLSLLSPVAVNQPSLAARSASPSNAAGTFSAPLPPAPLLVCCGACFFRSLLVRLQNLEGYVSASLESYKAEQEAKAVAAREAEAIQREREEKERADKASKGSGSNKKKSTGSAGSTKPVKAK